ncbi:MAG: hypothetical protein ACYDAI_11520 [Trichloromonadaceae bacterium]
MDDQTQKICHLMGVSPSEYEAARNTEQTATLNARPESESDRINCLMGIGPEYEAAANQFGGGTSPIPGLDIAPRKLAEAKAQVAKLMNLSPAEAAKRETETLRISQATAPLTVEELAACWALGITPAVYYSAKGVAAGLPPTFIE